MEWYCSPEKLHDILDRMPSWEFGVLGYWKSIGNKINTNIESFLSGDKSWVSHGMASNSPSTHCERAKYPTVADIPVPTSGIAVYTKTTGCYYMFLIKKILGIYHLLSWTKIFSFRLLACKDELHTTQLFIYLLVKKRRCIIFST